jgi:hypothetical protein
VTEHRNELLTQFGGGPLVDETSRAKPAGCRVKTVTRALRLFARLVSHTVPLDLNRPLAYDAARLQDGTKTMGAQ